MYGAHHEPEGVSGILVVDPNLDGSPIVYASPGFELITGYSAAEVLGRSPKLLQGPDTDPRAVAALREAIAAGRDAYVTLLNYRADGTPFWNELSIAPERDASGRIVRWLGVQRDVTDFMRRHARLQELAYFDQLTGLANSAALHDELRSALHRARVHDRQVALLLLDVDDLRHINDRYGRRVGDVLLRALADRLREIVRPQDLLARQDSDAFALLLRDLPGNAETVANELADRVLGALRTPFGADKLQLHLNVSIGIGLFPDEARTAAELLDGAQAAVEAAKASGKRRAHVWRRSADEALLVDPDAAFRPTAYARELGAILEAGALRPVFQPVVDLATRRVVAYEALTRGPEGSALHRPDRLLQTARATGRVVELDWACRAAAVEAALRAGLGREVPLMLNTEPEALGTPAPARHAELWERGREALDLIVEVRHAALADALPGALDALGAERRGGVGTALDDLGASTQALGLLPLLDAAALKLDPPLLAGRRPAQQAALAAAVADCAERTRAPVIAERIEDEEQLVAARALGARLGQGRLLGAPGPLPDRPAAEVRTAPLTESRKAPEAPGAADTPFAVLAAQRAPEPVTHDVLRAMREQVEARALGAHDGDLFLAVLGGPVEIDAPLRERYRAVAAAAGLVAVLTPGPAADPIPGTVTVALTGDDPLAHECAAIHLGPHAATALAARSDGDGIKVASTHDRGLVLAAARTLLARLPAGTSQAEDARGPATGDASPRA